MGEPFAAVAALKRLFTTVNSRVLLQVMLEVGGEQGERTGTVNGN